MAYSAVQLSQAQRSAYSADKPIALGINVLEAVSSANQVWRSWDASSYSGDNTFGAYTVASNLYDATDATYPTSLLSDRFTNSVSRALKPPGIATAYNDRWSFIFYAPGSGVSLDSVAILGHNFGTLSKAYGTYGGGSAFTVSLGVSDDGATWTTVATFTDPQTNKPLTSFDLANGAGSPSTFASFLNVAYFAVSIVCPSANMGQTPAELPEMAELVVGSRFQFLHQARVGYNNRDVGNTSSRVFGVTGASGIDISNSGGRKIEGTYQLTSDKTDFVSLYETALEQGMKPFLYVPKGSKAKFPTAYLGAEPGEAFWVSMADSNLNIMLGESYLDTSVELQLLESAPYNSSVT